MWAADKNHAEIVQILVDADADVDSKDISVSCLLAVLVLMVLCAGIYRTHYGCRQESH